MTRNVRGGFPQRYAFPVLCWIVIACALAGDAAADTSSEAAARASKNATPVAGEISDQEVIRRFLAIWRKNPFGVLANRWYGIRTLQNPVDAWIVQEYETTTVAF